MSAFVPLNVYQDDLQDVEEHTRELQIEEALKLYQRALRLQKDKSFAEARGEYDALFRIEVIQLRPGSGLPASVEKFRYLAYKNYAMLLLAELEQTYSCIDDIEDYREKVGDILDSFTEALTYEFAEPEFMCTVFAVAKALKNLRISRLILEHITFSENRPIPVEEALLTSINDTTCDLNRPLIDPYEYQLLFKLRDFLVTLIGDDIVSNSRVAEILSSFSIHPALMNSAFNDIDYSWLTKKFDISDSLTHLFDEETKEQREITLMTKTWDSVALALSDMVSNFLPKGRKRSLVEDPYTFSKTPVRVLTFNFHDGDGGVDQKMTTEDEERPAETEIHRVEEEEEVDKESAKNEEKDTPKAQEGDKSEICRDTPTVEIAAEAGPSSIVVEEVSEEPNQTKTDAAIDETELPDADNLDRKRKLTTLEAEQPSRSSKRVKSRTEDNKVETGLVDDAFFSQLNSFLALCGEDLQFDSILSLRQAGGTPQASDQFLVDFREMLRSWDETLFDLFQGSENLLFKSGTGDSSSEGQVPVMQLLDFATLGASDLLHPTFESNESDVEAFISKVNESKLNIQQFRVAFVERMMICSTNSQATYDSSWLNDFWPSVVYDTVRRTAEVCEHHFLAIIPPVLFGDSLEHKVNMMNLAESLFELFADTWVGIQKKLRRSKDKSKAMLKDLDLKSSVALARLLRWQTVVGDLLSSMSQKDEELTGVSTASPTNESEPELVDIIRLRYAWTSIVTSPAHGALPGDMLSKFEIFASELSSLYPEAIVEFPNCANIPKLSVESAQTQVSKYRAASIFAEIFKHKAQNETELENKIDVLDRIMLLESILIPGPQADNRLPEHDAIVQFLSMSSQEFRLQLWYILLDAYDRVGETVKAFDGYLRIFCSTIDELISPQSLEVVNGNSEQKRVFLLRYFNICYDIVASLMRLLSADRLMLEKHIPLGRRQLALKALIQLIRLVYLAIVLDVPLTSYWAKSIKKFQELGISCWCFFYLLYKSCLPPSQKTPEVLNDILSIIHEDVGLKKYCSASNGRLLDLILSELTELDWSESEADMLQALHCRYDLALGNEDFSPFDHRAQSGPITRQVALSLVPFLVNMILRRKNIIQTLSQNNVRRVLEQVVNATGDPSNLSSCAQVSVKHNMSLIDNYLNCTMVTADLIQESLKGGSRLGLRPTSGDMATIARKGLYFLMGLNHLNQFKIRKRTKELKVEDVDEVVKYFKYDLAFGEDRFESWAGIAQVYFSLVEDSLTWSADKLQSDEGKDGKEGRKHIGEFQRRTILACLMAIRVNLNGTAPDEPRSLALQYDQLSVLIWRILAETCYGACRPPMQTKEAFQNNLERLSMKIAADTQSMQVNSNRNFRMVSDSMILKLCHFALRLLMKKAPKDWYYSYFDAKILHHLEADPTMVIERVLRSIKHSQISSEKTTSPDFIFEPHYKLVTLVYKYVKLDKITVEAGLKYLEETPFSSVNKSRKSTPSNEGDETEQEESVDNVAQGEDNHVQLTISASHQTENDIVRASKESSEETIIETPDVRVSNAHFYELCLDALEKMRAADKRKWHHRPAYRMAEIYDTIFKDKRKAKDIMSGLINLKQTNKSPLNFWKPDLERPGHHFQFAYQYIDYFLSLAKWSKDTEAISILARKIRRFSSGMVRNNQVWERLLVAVSLLVREFLEIEPRFSDGHIATLILEEFEKQSKKLSTYAERARESELSPLYDALEYVADLRKINISFGSTSQLDDCFVSIYLLIYLDFKSKNYTERISVESLMSSKQQQNTAPVTPPVPIKKTRVSRKEIIAKGTALVKTVAPIIKHRKKNVLPRVHRSNIEKQGPTASLSSSPPNDQKMEPATAFQPVTKKSQQSAQLQGTQKSLMPAMGSFAAPNPPGTVASTAVLLSPIATRTAPAVQPDQQQQQQQQPGPSLSMSPSPFPQK